MRGFRAWLEAIQTVTNAKRTGEGGITLTFADGSSSDELTDFMPSSHPNEYIIRTKSQPSGAVVITQHPHMGDLIQKYLKASKKPEQLTVDEIMFYPTDGTPRTPPRGWDVEFMDMPSASALRAAYAKGIGPGFAHKIAEFVMLFSGHPTNLDKRMTTWILGQMGEDVFPSDVVAMKRQMRDRTERAAKYHKHFMETGYKLPPQGPKSNGLTAKELLGA